MSLKVFSLSILAALVLSAVATFANLASLVPLPVAYFIVALLGTTASWLSLRQANSNGRNSGKSTGQRQQKKSAAQPDLLNGGSTETGQVKWFSSNKGFGFITRDSGDDIFVHFRSIAGKGHRVLREGQRVEFAISENSKGLQAEDVNILNQEDSP